MTTCDAKPRLGGNDAGEWVAAPAHAAKAFRGTLSVLGVFYAGATINVRINGVKEGQVVLATGGALLQRTPLSVAIPAGLVVVRLEVVTGGLNLQSIAINGFPCSQEKRPVQPAVFGTAGAASGAATGEGLQLPVPMFSLRLISPISCGASTFRSCAGSELVKL